MSVLRNRKTVTQRLLRPFAEKTNREGAKDAKEKEQSYEKDKEGIKRMVNGL
jgi:hypothetical protein